MSGSVEAATFSWRLTVVGAEAVSKAFGTVGKAANTNMASTAKGTDAASKSLTLLTKQLEGMSRQAEGLDRLRRQLLAIAQIGGAALLVERSLNAASSVKKMADETGFAVTSVQELSYAMKQFHVEQSAAAAAMQTFSGVTSEFVTQNSGPAKQAFETLFGADAQKVAQQGLANVDQFFMQVLDRIGKMKNEAQKIELAKDIFGRSAGPAIVGFANAGIEKMRELREEAERLGIVFSDEIVDKASDAEDKFSNLSTILKTKLYAAILDNVDVIDAFATTVIEALPEILDMFATLARYIKTIGDLIEYGTIKFGNFGIIGAQALHRLTTPGEWWRGASGVFNLDALPDPLMAFTDPMLTLAGSEVGDAEQSILDPEKTSRNRVPPRGDSAAAGASVSAAKAQAEAYDKLTFSLKEQLKAVGETDRQQFISNELRKLGAKATQEQRDEIASLAGMLYDERQAWSTMENAATSAFSVITDGLEAAITNAEDFDDVLKNVLKSLAQVAYKALIGDPVSQGFSNLLSGGGGLGGIFSGFLGGGGSGISLGGGLTGSFAGDGMSFIPKFDIGTDYVQRTGLAMIHEGESIVPAKANRGYSGGKSNVFNVDMRGASVEAVERLERMVKEVNGSIENRALMAFQQAGIRSLGF